jgi:energy-coupling factor transporter transmembrane protein EcfT
MTEILIAFWLFVFAIFFFAGIITNSKYLSVISGLWLLIFSLLIIITGVYIQSGTTMTVTGNVSESVTNYQEVVVPYTTYAVIWGVFLLLTSFYIVVNAMDQP